MIGSIGPPCNPPSPVIVLLVLVYTQCKTRSSFSHVLGVICCYLRVVCHCARCWSCSARTAGAAGCIPQRSLPVPQTIQTYNLFLHFFLLLDDVDESDPRLVQLAARPRRTVPPAQTLRLCRVSPNPSAYPSQTLTIACAFLCLTMIPTAVAAPQN